MDLSIYIEIPQRSRIPDALEKSRTGELRFSRVLVAVEETSVPVERLLESC